ncbi:MAG TPA: bifunctional UDP-sugar hydrolase/5'-nucleotidase [Spirochaetota bacterium]|nr:bifunctional UDP-sugar hydrolase/5'-nucleotidase [Spirochaetota bacterium]
MKKSILMIIVIIIGIAPGLSARDRRITLVHTNDMHSHLLGFYPNIDYTPQVNDDATRGGWARIMTVIKKTRAERTNPVLVVDAGDFLMGSLFHMICRERALELRLMKDMGYDVITLGNHEFDLKPAGLARILKSARQHGGLPAIVSSNVIFSEKDDRDNALEEVFRDGTVKPYTVIETGGARIGFFGLIGKDAAEVAPFAKPVKFGDPAENARKMVDLLRNREKVDLVVCLSHSGLNLDAISKSEDVQLAGKVPGIDIIISGHTHTPLKEPVIKGNTIIVQAWCYGLWVGVMDIVLRDGRATLGAYRIVEIDDTIPGDNAITAVVNGYKNEISGTVLAPIGLAFDTVIAKHDYDLTIAEDESNLGNLIADASRWYVNRFVYDPRDPHSKVDVAFDSNGLIRDPVVKGKTGRIAVCDMFNALPLGIGKDDTMGYPMAAVYLYAAELKKALEILTSIHPLKGSDYFLQISGLKFTYNPRRMLFDRVTSIQIGNDEEGYRPLDYSDSNKQLYRVTANLYNATFLDIVGNFTMNILKIIPKDRNGKPYGDLAEALVDADPNRPGIQEVKQWVGLMEYVRSFKDTDGDGYPEIPEKYRGKLGRTVREPSLNPALLLKGGTYMTWIGFAMVVLVVAIVAVVSVVVVKKVRK